MSFKKLLYLFDVDGTLTAPRQKISSEMLDFMRRVQKQVPCALVGGSDLSKIAEQMGGMNVAMEFEFVFAENGLVAYKKGEQIGKESIQSHLGEDTLQKFINFCLHYMSGLTLPRKRGTFIEFRTGLINVCPVGRSCSQSERDQFDAYDKEHHIRAKFVEAMNSEFGNCGLQFSIGGQISIDVFPKGWDKTYCLKFLNCENTEIHFFGDKTQPGENDYEIYSDSRTVGHRVTSAGDTRQQILKLLKLDSIDQL